MRTLTDEERAVLNYKVAIDEQDPVTKKWTWRDGADDWWIAAQAHPDPEAALAAKVARWKPEYEAEKAKPDYKTRAQRETAYLAAPPAVPLTAAQRATAEKVMPADQVEAWAAGKVQRGGTKSLKDAIANIEKVRD